MKPEQQDIVIAEVRRIVRTVRVHQAAVRKNEMTPRSAKEAFERQLARLRERLKDMQ